MFKDKRVSLSITSCKRIFLLERVLKAFVVFCSDIDIIDEIIFFDDSSSQSDKLEMEQILNNLFKDKKINIKHFYPNSFEDNYRHSRILNNWREKLIETKTDYCFHLEDDYLFVNFFSIGECIDLLEEYPEYGYVNLSQSWKKFPTEFKPKEIGNYWEWIYLKDRPINECLFLDEVAAIQTPIVESHLVSGKYLWLMYINWPSFSLRPGILNVEKLLSIGEFSTTYDSSNMSVELEFAIRWGEKYKALCNKNFNIINLAIDNSMSAYNINNSNR